MKIIDNFLEEEYFNRLTNLICSTRTGFAWYYDQAYQDIDKPSTHVSDMSISEDKENTLFTHLIYTDHVPKSEHYELMMPLMDELEKEYKEQEIPHIDKHHSRYNKARGMDEDKWGIRSLFRIRVNCFPNTSTLKEYRAHTDAPFPHTSALLALNTCDGYTKLADGTKIDSVANQIVLFDGSEEHSGTTTTNANARFHINVNYF